MDRPVWVRDKVHAWVKGSLENGVVLDADGARVDLELEEGEIFDIATSTSVLPVNEFENEQGDFSEEDDAAGYVGVRDLTTLTHLHEPAILETLNERFLRRDAIYTYTGPILLAVNPFKPLTMYTAAHLELYYMSGLARSQGVEVSPTPPHVYAVADNAYRNLMDTASRCQSILVSGESGAGKTESTKFVMKYLATVANDESSSKKDELPEIAQRVLRSNPILEAFGNARTVRNDNSSRFGKFIEMGFDRSGRLVGAKIRTYLLEKVRLANQGEGERNFHVFYQLMKGASDEEADRLKLPESLEDCSYTNQSNCYDRRDGVDDEDEFSKTKEAMRVMQFSNEQQTQIFQIVSAVLNLSMLEIVPADGGEASEIDSESEAVLNVAELLEFDASQLIASVTTRTIDAMGESYVKSLNVEKAIDARDALCRTLYTGLFDWVVAKVNSAIFPSSAASEPVSKRRALASSQSTNPFIGVLDIFGFEVFETNSFEQLCINFANETLQAEFNHHVFKLEQALYDQENIQWSFVDFPDNEPVLNLIKQKKPPGLLALLDEQCLFPSGNDKGFANKCYNELLGKFDDFKVDSKQKVGFKFVVRHYAGDVEYDTLGFCAKNKDELHSEGLKLLRTSGHSLVCGIFPDNADAKKKKRQSGSLRSETVGTQFKNQLADLIKTIRSTEPHYVRCLKPNDENVPNVFNRPRMVDQLRYGGVLEAVKVTRAGYPNRFDNADFVVRYWLIAKSICKGPRDFESCERLCLHLDLESPSEFQRGKTKVFLRKSGYEKLESKRTKIRSEAATKIAAEFLSFSLTRRFKAMKSAALKMQSAFRVFLAKLELHRLRQNKAAKLVTAFCRGALERARFRRVIAKIVKIQAVFRGMMGRRLAKVWGETLSAVKVQSFVRMAVARRKFVSKKSLAIEVQRVVRGRLARQELRRLRREMRDVGGLREQIEALKARVAELESENADLRAGAPAPPRAATVDDGARRDEVDDLKARLQKTKASAAARITELEALVAGLKVEAANAAPAAPPDLLAENLMMQIAELQASEKSLKQEIELLRKSEDANVDESSVRASERDALVEERDALFRALEDMRAAEEEREERRRNEQAYADALEDDGDVEVLELKKQLNDANHAIQTLNQRMLSEMNANHEENSRLNEHNRRLRVQLEDSGETVQMLTREKSDLLNKMTSLESLTVQASSVKIKLARRLEALIMENRDLKQESEEKQVALSEAKLQLSVLADLRDVVTMSKRDAASAREELAKTKKKLHTLQNVN